MDACGKRVAGIDGRILFFCGKRQKDVADNSFTGRNSLAVGMEVQIGKHGGLSRNGIIATSAPRMTAKHPAHGQIEAFKRPVFADGFDGILRACGSEPARRRGEWGNALAVKLYGRDEDGGQQAEEKTTKLIHGRKPPWRIA